MKKLVLIVAAAGALVAAAPTFAQDLNVRIGNGMERHHNERVVVRERRPRTVVVVQHRNRMNEGWRHRRMGEGRRVIIER